MARALILAGLVGWSAVAAAALPNGQKTPARQKQVPPTAKAGGQLKVDPQAIRARWERLKRCYEEQQAKAHAAESH